MVALYYNVDSLREGDSSLVLQFVASHFVAVTLWVLSADALLPHDGDRLLAL